MSVSPWVQPGLGYSSPMNLLPLEALPGWPAPTHFSDLFMWMLMVIGPLAVGAVITLLVFAPKLAGRSRGADVASTELTTRQQ